MITALTKGDLVKFEDRVAKEFNKGIIQAPIHLYSGNEENVIDVFQEIGQSDWILCSWRSHYQCLLKGVPEEDVFQGIMEGRSISLCFPEYKNLLFSYGRRYSSNCNRYCVVYKEAGRGK